MTNAAKATRVATLPGQAVGGAVAFSPGGRLLADVSYDGTVILFNVTDPARPARAATMRTLAAALLPDSSATDYNDTQCAVALSPDGHTLTANVDSAPDLAPPGAPPLAAPPGPPARDTVPVWNVTRRGHSHHHLQPQHHARRPGGVGPPGAAPSHAVRPPRWQHGGPMDAALTHLQPTSPASPETRSPLCSRSCGGSGRRPGTATAPW